MIEQGVAVDTLMAAMRTNDAALIASVFRREHVPTHSPWGDIWYPKGHPNAPEIGCFEPEGEKS